MKYILSYVSNLHRAMNSELPRPQETYLHTQQQEGLEAVRMLDMQELTSHCEAELWQVQTDRK